MKEVGAELSGQDRRNGEGDLERATFGGGCFWCLEPIFAELRGVIKVVPGYAGGHVPNPTYEQVCTGTTGHAEVVQITFDPGQISYRELLEVFFAVHDPTTLNRQGADVGTQYRSVIFYHSPSQREAAEDAIAAVERSGVWGAAKVVTEVQAATDFFEAEQYHWDYFQRNANQPYCRLVIAPKLAKFREQFAAARRDG